MIKHCPVCGAFMGKVEDGWICKEHGFYPSTADSKAILRMVGDHLMRLQKSMVREKPDPISQMPYMGTGESLILVWSDWHIGRLNVVRGKEVWNMKIAEESVNQIIKNVKDIFDSYLEQHLIEDIHVFILGDIVDDEKVFPMQPYKVEKTVIHQFKEASRILCKALTKLAEYGIPVFVHTKSGNHKDKDTHPTSSWDNAVYVAAEIGTSFIDNVHWDIDLDARHVATIRGHRYLIMHGNDAPKQCETAAGRAKWGGWYERYKYDAAVLGHFHHMKLDDYNGRPIIYNGTVMMGDDYTEQLSYDDSLPTQTIFGCSNKRPMTFVFRLDTR